MLAQYGRLTPLSGYQPAHFDQFLTGDQTAGLAQIGGIVTKLDAVVDIVGRLIGWSWRRLETMDFHSASLSQSGCRVVSKFLNTDRAV